MTKYILDINAVISLFQGEESIVLLCKNASWIGVSIISVIEFLSYPEILDEVKKLFIQFINENNVVDLTFQDSNLIEYLITLRKSYRLKIPDAIIIASTYSNNAILITRDKGILNKEFSFVISF